MDYRFEVKPSVGCLHELPHPLDPKAILSVAHHAALQGKDGVTISSDDLLAACFLFNLFPARPAESSGPHDVTSICHPGQLAKPPRRKALQPQFLIGTIKHRFNLDLVRHAGIESRHDHLGVMACPPSCDRTHRRRSAEDKWRLFAFVSMLDYIAIHPHRYLQDFGVDSPNSITMLPRKLVASRSGAMAVAGFSSVPFPVDETATTSSSSQRDISMS